MSQNFRHEVGGCKGCPFARVNEEVAEDEGETRQWLCGHPGGGHSITEEGDYGNEVCDGLHELCPLRRESITIHLPKETRDAAT